MALPSGPTRPGPTLTATNQERSKHEFPSDGEAGLSFGELSRGFRIDVEAIRVDKTWPRDDLGTGGAAAASRTPTR
jgi:hypothetical protein